MIFWLTDTAFRNPVFSKSSTFERSFGFLEDNSVEVLRIVFQKFQDAFNVFEASFLQ